MITHDEALKVARLWGAAETGSAIKIRANTVLCTYIRALPGREQIGAIVALSSAAWDAGKRSERGKGDE